MTDYRIKVDATTINASPELFWLIGRDFHECFLTVRSRKQFSIVPFFLCFRAIELALKAVHLLNTGRSEIKRDFGHDLWRLYSALPKESAFLTKEQEQFLQEFSTIYLQKGFEYVSVTDVCTAFERFPDLDALGELTRDILVSAGRIIRPDEP